MNNKVAIPVPDLASDNTWLRRQSEKWNKDLKFLIRQTRVITLLLKHPAVPWYAKLVAGCTLGYLLSPIQVIPTFIPVIGQLDDLAALLVGMKLLRLLTPEAVLAECESKTDSTAVVAGLRSLATTKIPDRLAVAKFSAVAGMSDTHFSSIGWRIRPPRTSARGPST